MSQIYRCDFCGKDVPTETSLQELKFGDSKVGDACYNCASTLKGAMIARIAETQKIVATGAGTMVQKPKVPDQEQKPTTRDFVPPPAEKQEVHANAIPGSSSNG